MKHVLLTSVLLIFSLLGARGAVDENFYIYLCFGQSNMEGNAQPESVDQTVDERFQMLACVNFQNPVRTMGNWYPATPPIVRQGTYLLRLMTPQGQEYSVWEGYAPGYLNGFSTFQDCSFVLGLNNQNGQDVPNGAVWNIQYVEGKGFFLKNLYTGKYLKNAQSAKFEAPTYFTFCTLKQQTVAGVQSVPYREITDGVVYNLQGMKVSIEDEWENLPQGLYIINGKKIVKR